MKDGFLHVYCETNVYRFEFMMALLDRDPDLFLDEISNALVDQHNLNISLSTVYRTLKYMGYGSKKVEFQYFSLIGVDMVSLSYQKQHRNEMKTKEHNS
jgi:hypothetical protein